MLLFEVYKSGWLARRGCATFRDSLPSTHVHSHVTKISVHQVQHHQPGKEGIVPLGSALEGHKAGREHPKEGSEDQGGLEGKLYEEQLGALGLLCLEEMRLSCSLQLLRSRGAGTDLSSPLTGPEGMA